MLRERVSLAERVLRWVLRHDRLRTTPSCGPHCSLRIIRAAGEYAIPAEYHCRHSQCHGKKEKEKNMSSDDRPPQEYCECGLAMTWFGDHWVCVNVKLHDKIMRAGQ